MNKAIPTALIFIYGLLILILLKNPSLISDNNTFLRSFSGHEFLGTIGVILAITLASLAQAHLSINNMERERGENFLQGTRKEIRSSAGWLIWLFLVAIFCIAAKPILSYSEQTQAGFNALMLFILAIYILILADITSAIFDIK